MIHQLDFNGIDKVEKAIKRLKLYEPPEGYYLCFSGGKDSVVIKALADMAGVKYDAHYSISSVDPPELVRFIKDEHPDVIFEHPRDENGNVVTMWNLIPTKTMPPTRIVRYCCAALKETGGKGRLKITGVRWDESSRRKRSHSEVTVMDKKAPKFFKEFSDEDYFVTPQGGVVLPLDKVENRRMVEACYKNHSTTINPIVDWTTSEVWEFILENDLPYCSLYDEGFARLGCIGCPMASKKMREYEFERWPKYKKLYLLAFEKMIELHGGALRKYNDPEQIMRGYMSEHFDESGGGVRPFRDTPDEVMEWWIDLK